MLVRILPLVHSHSAADWLEEASTLRRQSDPTCDKGNVIQTNALGGSSILSLAGILSALSLAPSAANEATVQRLFNILQSVNKPAASGVSVTADAVSSFVNSTLSIGKSTNTFLLYFQHLIVSYSIMIYFIVQFFVLMPSDE